ncbi:MAG: 50S ribosomal protein L31e [Archaeoglobaceae archaeon]|nr:50S ribosomal protein L31e [Archaeoglobaceae archaeon]MDW7989724.1 50S ribosomal protein L31e [Archaeoglobaceae archaeon]
MANIQLERIYSIRLRQKLVRYPRWLRSKKSVKYIRNFLSRHMKVSPEKVKFDEKVNEFLWSRGAKWAPARIRIRAVKFDDGVVEVELA